MQQRLDGVQTDVGALSTEHRGADIKQGTVDTREDANKGAVISEVVPLQRGKKRLVAVGLNVHLCSHDNASLLYLSYFSTNIKQKNENGSFQECECTTSRDSDSKRLICLSQHLCHLVYAIPALLSQQYGGHRSCGKI